MGVIDRIVFIASGSHLAERPGINQLPTAEGCLEDLAVSGTTVQAPGTHAAHRRNVAGTVGGALGYNVSSRPIITNCTFADNSANNGGGAVYSASSSFCTIRNCILWNDSPNEIFRDGGSVTVSYSDVQGGFYGVGNIDADPLFTVDSCGEYSLSSGSPCIDAGDNDGVPVGAATHLAEQIETLPNLKLTGLMTMAPLTHNKDVVRSCFVRARELFEEIRGERIVGPHFTELSMGMSSDYEVAVDEGATILRIGSAIFAG